MRYMVRIHFPSSNNVAEYEALINGLCIAIELGIRQLDVRGDSHLVINQGTRPRVNRKRRNQVGSIKPVSTPISYRINQVIVKEFTSKTLAKPNPAVTPRPRA